MKIVDSNLTPARSAVGDMTPGSVVINGEGNLCIVCKGDNDGQIRLVNLANGGTYMVNKTCKHEQVDAVLTWKRNG